jgi:2-polyprenyl-6-methoxyphenol hydroxylase-like FAD-dependent oxidoreductase
MRIVCVGAGPAGLYFALLMKLHDPGHDITIFERNAIGSSHSWGVVFGEGLVNKLHSGDPESAGMIERAAFRWVNQVVDVQGKQVRAGGRGYAINRQRLLDILVHRAQGLGVRIEFGREVLALTQLPAADLIVACDGVNSPIRRQSGVFQTNVHMGSNKYIWLGTEKVFGAFTFPFVHTGSGWIWAHAYGVDAQMSTFIVECSSETWTGLGFDMLPPQDGLHFLQRLFERHLDGRRLIGQDRDDRNARWMNFCTVTNQLWYDGNTVLAGDAAHTTHFTIGSGTKLAIEDVITLAENMRQHGELKLALQSYQTQRQAELLQPQTDALLSAQWFENLPRYIGLEPDQFSTLLHARRSPLLPRLPPRLCCQLHQVTEEVAFLHQLRTWVGPKATAIYSRIRAMQTGVPGPERDVRVVDRAQRPKPSQ